jgi:hypothetical protein
MNRTIEDLAASFATSRGVEALVLAGSMTSGLADEGPIMTCTHIRVKRCRWSSELGC